MKVRHKDQSKVATFVVIEETAQHYIAHYDGCFKSVILLPKTDFEPIPEEQWVDVTGECEVWAFGINPNKDEYYISHRGTIPHKPNYRFVKVLMPNYRFVKGHINTVAFRIERKVK